MDFVDEIDSQRTTNFKVTKIPVLALRRFKKLCKEEFGDIYFVGIIQLMKSYQEEKDKKALIQRIIDLEEQLAKYEGKKKTFGR